MEELSWHFVLVSLAWTIYGLQTFAMVFADRQPSWQCRSSPSQSLTSASTSFSNAALNITATGDDRSIGVVIVPTIVALDHYNSAIPFGLFAAAALVGALLALCGFLKLSTNLCGRLCKAWKMPALCNSTLV